jgi:hypothetical protein
MDEGEEQTLTYSTPVCSSGEPALYTWQLTGPGTLTPNGESATYLSPNPVGCSIPADETATVSVLCGGAVIDVVTIYLHHKNASGAEAFFIAMAGNYSCWYNWYWNTARLFIDRWTLYCNGDHYHYGSPLYFSKDKVDCAYNYCDELWGMFITYQNQWEADHGVSWPVIYSSGHLIIKDRRTQAMKDAGCCPDWSLILAEYAPQC